MKENVPIEIFKVANGFIVKPENRNNQGLYSDLIDVYVFPDIPSLHKWMFVHFKDK